MRELAVIGAGLCGLALSHSLQARRADWVLYEARARLGGRVFTQAAADGTPLDLGATWYWPGHQPNVTRLVTDLGLPSVAQPDSGQVLLLDDPGRAPACVPVDAAAGPEAAGAVHGGARRLTGGMGALIDALARRLPAERLHLGVTLEAVTDCRDHVALHLCRRDADGEQRWIEPVRQLVLAMPPRLAAGLAFEPPLSTELHQALSATPTWMATAAKAALAGLAPTWRREPHRGNAWVTHPQAMLSECWDASPVPDDPAAAPAALAGFLALGAGARESFQAGMALLLGSQWGQLFGAAVEDGELHRHDWATDPQTCSAQDRADDDAGRTGVQPHPAEWLQHPHWQGRLHFGGSETARHGSGYLEGALSAAARLRQAVARPGAAAPP